VGLATAGDLAEIAAGVLGTAATWVASAGSSATGREAQTPRLVGACERQARVFFVGGGGALRCLAYQVYAVVGRGLRNAGGGVRCLVGSAAGYACSVAKGASSVVLTWMIGAG
jgi:hypothetical protein